MLIKVTTNDIRAGRQHRWNPISVAIWRILGDDYFLTSKKVVKVSSMKGDYVLPSDVGAKLLVWDVDPSQAEPFEFELEEVTNG